MIRDFGPESRNPRARRAYAHTLLQKAQKSGSLEDIAAARRVVTSIKGKKAERSGFGGALLKAVVADSDTKTIVSIAQEVLSSGERGPVLNNLPETYTTSISRHTTIFELGRKGVYLGRIEVRRHEDDALTARTQLTVTEHDGDKVGRVIPTNPEGVLDVMAIRQMPDERRSDIARMVHRIGPTPEEAAVAAIFSSMWTTMPEINPYVDVNYSD